MSDKHIPHDWLRPGDMLLAIRWDPSQRGLFTSRMIPRMFVGPPLTMPPAAGAYYAKHVCQKSCDGEDAVFSSRHV